MDIQQLKTATEHINSVPAQQESKPLKTGEQQLENALSGTKVCNASLDSLKAILRRVMLLVGIRAANMPTDEEKGILTAFIYKKYSALTLEEIQLAFEKAVAGELECEANCYENFSCAYFGQIMAAYKQWATQKFNENQMYVAPPKKEFAQIPVSSYQEMQGWMELTEMNFQQYKTGKYNIDLWPWQTYKACVEGNFMSVDAYEDWLEDSYNKLLAKGYQTPREKEKYLEIKTEGIYNAAVIETAKRLAVEYLYKTAVKKGYKNLFVFEKW